MNEQCEKHDYEKWQNEYQPYWRRECYVCGHAERSNELTFIQWLWNLRPW